MTKETHLTNNNSKRVLIVEDDATISFLLDSFLKSKGYTTETASDGVVALVRLVEDQNFDLIITDYQMPKLQGDEFIKKARTMVPLLKASIILISAHFDLPSLANQLEVPFVNKGSENFLVELAKLVNEVSNKSPEERKYPRFELTGHFQNSFISSEGNKYNGKPIDISEGGMGILLDKKPDQKDVLTITFLLANNSTHEFSYSIQWIKQLLDPEGTGYNYRCGLSFIAKNGSSEHLDTYNSTKGLKITNQI